MLILVYSIIWVFGVNNLPPKLGTSLYGLRFLSVMFLWGMRHSSGGSALSLYSYLIFNFTLLSILLTAVLSCYGFSMHLYLLACPLFQLGDLAGPPAQRANLPSFCFTLLLENVIFPMVKEEFVSYCLEQVGILYC